MNLQLLFAISLSVALLATVLQWLFQTDISLRGFVAVALAAGAVHLGAEYARRNGWLRELRSRAQTVQRRMRARASRM